MGNGEGGREPQISPLRFASVEMISSFWADRGTGPEKKPQISPLRVASVEMTSSFWADRGTGPEKKPQISPLRFAPVEMTNLLETFHSSGPNELVISTGALSAEWRDLRFRFPDEDTGDHGYRPSGLRIQMSGRP